LLKNLVSSSYASRFKDIANPGFTTRSTGNIFPPWLDTPWTTNGMSTFLFFG
jgi:hypothetical protein